MNYFPFAIATLFLYAGFMITKFSLRIKITKTIEIMHIIIALLAFSLFFILWMKEIIITLLSLLSLIFIIPGVTLIVLAGKDLKMQTFKPGKKLVAKGVYKCVRNPMYLGIILIALGAVISTLSRNITIYALTLICVYIAVIKIEEKELSARLGKEYEAYKEKVPSLIPIFRKNSE